MTPPHDRPLTMHERFAIIIILSIGLALVLTSCIIISTLSGEESFHYWWGKETKQILTVVDDDGKPVEGAKVTIRFRFIDLGKINTVVKQTDADGRVEVRGRCADGVDYTIEKEGWYKSHGGVNYAYREYSGVPFKDGKWLPYGEEKTISFRRIIRPTPMVVFKNLHFPVPECGKDYGYDLEYGTLVEPYGPGKVADFFVRYTMEGEPYAMGRDLTGSRVMTISFPNCLDGAYPFEFKSNTDFKSPYHADNAADYVKTITWKVVWGEGIVGYKNEALGYGQGYVLRTRTKVDSEGKLISAHYGKMYGRWDICGHLAEKWPHINQSGPIFFNPVENDTSLEYDNKPHPEMWEKTGYRGERPFDHMSPL